MGTGGVGSWVVESLVRAGVGVHMFFFCISRFVSYFSSTLLLNRLSHTFRLFRCALEQAFFVASRLYSKVTTPSTTLYNYHPLGVGPNRPGVGQAE